MSKQFVSTITEAGYLAAINNNPDDNGFKVSLAHLDAYSGGVKKGRFPLTGTIIGGKQVRVRASINTTDTEYFFDEVRLIDGTSGSEFAVVKREDGSNIDFVSPFKTAFFQIDLTFAALNENVVTVVSASDEINALWAELDTRGKVKWSAITGVPDATATQKGIVKLSDRVDVQNNTDAVTSQAVQNAIDNAKNNISWNDLLDKPSRKIVHTEHIRTDTGDRHPQSYQVFGNSIYYPDGRIVQTFWLRGIRDIWFNQPDAAVGYRERLNDGHQIPLVLWKAMPTMIVSVSAQPQRTDLGERNTPYFYEAAEQVCGWAKHKQGRNLSRVFIDMARTNGGQSETIDLYVVVEGF